MDIFVGNLLFEATAADVRKLFEAFGNVSSVVITMGQEKKAPKSRGFGFVQMHDEPQALSAIAALNGKEFMGRVLNVELARTNPAGIANKPRKYKGGRRTRSYIRRQGLSRMQEDALPRQGTVRGRQVRGS